MPVVLRRSTLRPGLLAALLTAAPVASFAAETATKEGMPQLNFANPLTMAQAVWMFVIFLALYLLLSRWALPQVAEVVESRAASIAADLTAAQEAKARADAAIAELTDATRRAHAEAQARVAEAIAAAKAESAEQARAANERLDAQLAAAEARIGQAQAAAMGALRQVATDTAALLVGRLTGQQADAGAVDAAVGRALADRPQAA